MYGQRGQERGGGELEDDEEEGNRRRTLRCSRVGSGGWGGGGVMNGSREPTTIYLTICYINKTNTSYWWKHAVPNMGDNSPPYSDNVPRISINYTET